MSIVITREKMTEALEWVLTQVDPDYSYPHFNYEETECFYIDKDGCGDCLFGRALIYLGVDPEFLQSIDNGERPDHMDNAGIEEILHYFNRCNDEEFPDEDLIEACRMAQADQDLGIVWVDCVQKYKERLAGKHVIL